jgi:NAD(P)-dependent dehydrogenase (short-subunit alcohol dehydrogenase family)
MSENRVLEGKVVLVTGAGGGIGEGIARLAAAQGASVVVNDLGTSPGGEGADAKLAQVVTDSIVVDGGKAVANFDSIAEWDGAQRMVQQAVDTFGRIDGVVNNAGILRDVIFHKISIEDWHAVINVNLTGYFYVSRAAAPIFKEQGSGSYVHMTSTSGLVGNLAQVNYMASKMGVVGLSKSIALDMQRFNVNSNCIAPFAFTSMSGTIPETDANRERLKVLRRMTPDKIAPMAVALLADRGRAVSGQVFGARMNELMLFSQNRPVRTAQTAEGWTPQGVLDTALAAFTPHMTPLERSSEYFSWDPF